jgi:nitrate/nitrite transport system ATP-binding protein
MSFIDIAHVSKAFRSGGSVRPVLEDVSLSIERGEFVSLVGHMGCGKSTLLNIAAGLLAPDAGRIAIGGEPVLGVRTDVAVVFQNYSLLPWLSALENVRLAVEAAFSDWPRARGREQAVRYLEMVGLGNALHRRPSQLSGGMRQRVAIARAFATEPAILFLDEPFGALDALTRGTLQQELARMCWTVERPVTTLMITNNVDEAVLLSDRIVAMRRPARGDGVPAEGGAWRGAGDPANQTMRRGERGARLAASIPIDLPRPRAAAQLLHDDGAVRLRSRVIEALTAGAAPKPALQIA